MSFHFFSKIGSRRYEVKNQVEILLNSFQEGVVKLISKSCIVTNCSFLILKEVDVKLLVLFLLFLSFVRFAHPLHHSRRSLLLNIDLDQCLHDVRSASDF